MADRTALLSAEASAGLARARKPSRVQSVTRAETGSALLRQLQLIQAIAEQGYVVPPETVIEACQLAEDMEAQMDMMRLSLEDSRAEQIRLGQQIVELRGRFEDDYELGALLGAGGFGQVFEAKSKRIKGGVVAVKRIDLHSSGADVHDIREEARLMTVAGGSHVVSLIAHYESTDHFYFVMEVLRGGELFVMMADHPNYTEAECRRVFTQLAMALDELQRAHVVHRDIKPENFLLTDKHIASEAKLCDFGLAVELGPGERLIDECGSPDYTAPEVGAATGYGREVDLWSAGVCLHLLLFGSLPERRSAAAAATTLHDADVVLPGGGAAVSADARSLVTGLLTVDPARRLGVAATLAHPWVTGQAAASATDASPLRATQASLQNFNARRKLRAGIQAVMGMHRLMGSMGK